MDSITSAWKRLDRRQQVLAASAAGAILLALLLVLLTGGDALAPVDGSTTTAASATAPVVEPTPGMIVSSNVPPQAAPASGGGGVAPLQASDSGGGDAVEADEDDADVRELERQALGRWRNVDSTLGVYQEPKVSVAVKVAGLALERVAAEYTACVQRAYKGDLRKCSNVMKDGVSITSQLHYDGRGVTLTKMSSDGHRLDFTVTPKGGECRVLDLADSCSGWVSG